MKIKNLKNYGIPSYILNLWEKHFSYQYPAELRQGIVRDGIFKYISSNKKKNTYRREIFFQPETVCDNCVEDYLLETVRYLVNQGEPTFDSNAESEYHKLTTVTTAKELKTETSELKPATVLEIDPHRPDRIIFQGKEIKVTAKEFYLIHLLAQYPEQVMSYDELLDKLWKDEEDAIYNRVSFHISKVRRTILKIIGKSKINKEKVKNIFTVISKRGVMLKLKADQIKIN
jgi:hypothetical protein